MKRPMDLPGAFEMEPVRLIEGDDGVAELLREEASRRPGPLPTFSELRAARGRNQIARNLAFGLAVLVPLAFFGLRMENHELPIVAEAPHEKEHVRTAPGLAPQEEQTTPAPDEPAQAQPQDQASSRVLPTSPPKSLPSQKSSTKRGPREALPSTLDCSAFSRQGRFDEALLCLSKAARGKGMGAELALLESARLRRHVTGDLAAALADLSLYEKEFPGGALRREAGLLKLDVLRQLGQHEKARASILRLLPEVPEQRAELLLQQFELDLALSDCKAAKSTLAALAPDSSELGGLAARLEQCASDKKR